MFKIIRSIDEINFHSITYVYAESLRCNAAAHRCADWEIEDILEAEQDLYSFLKVFLSDKESFVAVWEIDGRYTTALRLEPYENGYLISGLETAPADRGKGYAKQLMVHLLNYLDGNKFAPIYSHIDKSNSASIAVHKAVGFALCKDCASFIDGSVSHRAYTMCRK